PVVDAPIGDRAFAPAGMRREKAMIQDQIDSGTRSESRELLQKLDRLEHERCRAVVPLRLEPDDDAAVRHAAEALLSDGGAQDVPTELLQPSAIAGRHTDVGVQIEALEVGMARRP